MAAAAAAVAGGRQRSSHKKETALKHMEKHIDHALDYIQTGDIDNPKVYARTCMKLGSAIDWVIAVNAFPSSSHLPRLRSIVEEVYRRKTELLLPSLMLLMLPIKAACRIGWFPDGDKDGLLMIAKEVSYGFSDTDKMNIEPSNAHSSVLDIVSRFYPTMKVEQILTSFVVKAGYGTFVADFHISRGATPRHCLDLWLLVSQLDNMDTAACITSPLDVDFLINGSEVPNRTRNNMGNGPQLPSNVTKMIKYGLNLLQVFGDFDGQYIVALAFMNSISCDPSQLQDYIRPMSGGVNSDCDASESSSRVSLYCPVSQHRIKTPVKGHLCKHPQCFDYNYFIEVNSTKPTWKCPLCDNPVCNRDIRIDQDFLKILNEVAEDVTDVIISEDGSWMVAETNKDPMRHSTVTAPVVPLGQTQVNVCTTKQDQSTIVFTPPAGYSGQTRVNVSTTNQAQSTTMLTPPATVTKPAVPLGQTKVNVCTTKQETTAFTPTAGSLGQTQVSVGAINQAQSTTTFTPIADSRGQTRVNVGTTKQAQSTPVFTPPAVRSGQTQVNAYTTAQAKSSTMFRPPAGASGQVQVNNCTTTQAQSTTTPIADSPGQTEVKVGTTTQTQSTTVFAPSAIRPGHTRVNAYTTPQAKSSTMHRPPPGQTQVNNRTTNQAQSTTMFRPPAGAPGQTQVNNRTTNQAQSTTMFRPPAAVTRPPVPPGQTQVNVCTTTQAKSTTMLTPPSASQPPPNSRVSPAQLQEPSGDATPSGRMRGSLTGDKLLAARRQYLAPPQQPALANQPWSRPPVPPLPSPFLMPRTPANTDNVKN